MIVSSNPQNTPGWALDRCGVVTASEFNKIITPSGKLVTGATRSTYLYLKAAERVLKEVAPQPQTSAMREGHELEELSCAEYEWVNNVDVLRPGLIYLNHDKKIGASVDGLVGEHGQWENKSPQPKNHVSNLILNRLPSEHKQQVQGQLWVTGREWCDFTSFRPGLRRLQVRVYRDDEYITDLADAVMAFVAELDSVAESIV